ncbi:sacsin isoform X3 [Heterodontus francisci]|uniref:sacsin isoform X3 n=1 Tax=Heterodontus francisci TaxID=7792 RepID=UPI00355C3EC3
MPPGIIDTQGGRCHRFGRCCRRRLDVIRANDLKYTGPPASSLTAPACKMKKHHSGVIAKLTSNIMYAAASLMMASLLHRESQAGGSLSSSNRKMRKKFGATTPPFIDYLKEILRRYPDGGQILKELIQNADDAEANEVVFIFDERTYGTTSVFMKDLKKFQGPALIVYNNSVFSEEDWLSIQTTGISNKRNDPSKVGQFGLGFNTVYHITDLPSIFSGKYIGIFDPQEKLFGEQEAGYIWSLDDLEDRKALEHSRDQFRPFRYAMEATGTITWTNALKEQYFKGTLFRFPLRTEPSEILDNLYDKDKIFDLFDSFRADEDMSLLFLRNVASVCIKHIDTSGNVKVLLEITALPPEYIPSFNHNLNVERQELVSNIKTSTCIRAISHRIATEEHHNHWLITNCTGSAGEWANLDDLAERLSYTPYVGLAFPLSKAETTEAGSRTDFEGRLSFFLPLPNNEANKTGLPVHVNAFFGLSDNRRHIKWVESDQRYDEAAKWNELLIEKILPCAYCQLILDAITLAQTSVLKPSSVYRLWPDYEKMNHKERWVKITKETIKRLLELNVLCLAACEDKWIRADKAIFLQCYDRLDIRRAIESFLIKEAQPLVRVPSHVFKAILFTLENQSDLNVVTPGYLRSILQHCDLGTIPREQKLMLLEYVLSDEQYSSLKNFQLLPVSNGSFVKFQISACDEPVFTDSAKFPRILLPGLERSFLPEDLSDTLQDHLKKIAYSQIFANLICLDVHAIKQHIRKALPDNWMKKLGHVTWDITNTQHPPVHWLAEFWDFLNKNCKTLDKFEGLPLIPLSSLKDCMNSLQLAHLSKNITTIFQMQNGYKLPDTIASIITRAGGSVVQSSDEFLKHQQLAEYVFLPNPNNVLKLFLNLGCDQVVKEISCMSVEDRRSLRSFLAEASIFDTDEINMLFKLPIFQQMISLRPTNKGLITAGTHGALSNEVYPEIPEDVPLPETVLKCVDEKDRKLMLMKGKLLTAADVALLMLKGVETQKYEPEQVEKVMFWILKNSEILFKQKPELFNKCKTLRFLTSKDRVVQASTLFDPNNVTFQHLFQPEYQHSFPPPLYCKDEKILLTLQKLGLKSKEDSISPDDLLKVARLIDRQHGQASDVSNVCIKAEALIRVCNTTSVLAICSYQTVEQLLSLHWVPCNSLPKASAECKKINIDLNRPENVRDSKYANIIGLVMPLTDKFTEKASRILGLLNLPPPKKVVENLLAIIDQVSTSSNSQCNFLTDLQNIYEYMQKHLGQFKALLLALELPWVWNGAGFAHPQNIVFSYPEDLDLSCYVKRVPQEISQYGELLTECGVKTGYSNEEIIQILYRIKDNTVKLNSGYGSPSELKTIISILDWMRRNNFSFNNDLPVPVWKGTQGGFCLKPCSKAVLCDLDKGTLEDINKNENIFVIHKEISLAIVEWLNVPALSSKVLHPELIGIEQYGQAEPLVLRIKNILKEYDQEHDLFKEMLQNAEDAGSTVCSFLVDMRQNKDAPESLIDPDMASCHGPALWSYNNECFTDEDFHNITRIGTGSKENQIDKIGKFGLGFNSVYHITDVPSILSGKYLLIFDPNVTHLRKHIHSVTNPGIKLNLYEHRQLIQRFPGQFNPYNGIFGCNFKIGTGENFYYEGTLIKLPFRTPEEAAVSGLSNKYYNQKHIMSLVDSFKQTSKDLVIFLKNVKKVSLKFISEHSAHENQIISVFKMERQILNIIEMADNFPIKKMQQNAVNILESTNKFSRKIRSLSISTIIQFTEETIDNPNHIKYWLVHSCFGMAKALQIACSKTANAYFAPPLGSVAIPLKKRKETGHWMPNTEAHVGQVFCFLPLSLQCGLPVHINGSFAVTSNRKNLWSSGPKGDWNQALLEDAVSAAYVTSISLMQQMSQKGEFENYDYYTFWPNVNNVDNQFRVIMENFYRAVAYGINGVTLKAFSNGKDWCPINQARFLDSSILKNKRVGQSAVTEFSKFLSKPLISVHLPEWVKQGFIASGCEHSIEQNTYNWELFYKEIVFQNLDVINPKTRNDFIIHAIDMRDSSIDEMLRITPCMTASGKEDLQYIKNLVHPEGKIACLYDEDDGRFLVGTSEDFLHPERLLRLEMLGMVKDRIAFPQLLERAETIKQIWDLDRNKAYQRVRHILDLLKDLNELNNDDQQNLQNIPFLPAFLPHSQDKNGPVDTIVLMKAKDLYSCKCQALVNMTEMVLDKELLKGTKLSTETIFFLGLNRQPPIGTVLEQLKCTYTCNNLATSDLKRITKECYIYLTKQLKGDPESKKEIYNAAQEFPFIFVHGQFMPLTLVARKVSFDAVPYLYELPKEYIECEELWKFLEIKDHFRLEDYASVLKRMSEKYHGSRLSDSDLAVCLRIVTTGFAEVSEQEDILQSILLPNQHCILHSAQTLQYNDTPWLVVGDDVNLCHNQIARETAVRFHVQTTKHRAMKNLQVKDMSIWAQEFGQQEKLTIRLKNIIKAYPSKKDILKELIQNADDAEASEIHFIWDPRKHGNTKTFGEEWNTLQGPALCVYNNKKFTDKDIEGIQQLGEGGKRKSPEKTGKYGLGFNSVYHLTDCPSFMSGDSMLCIFDPHLAVLATAKPHSPGGMFIVNQKFKNTFEDVYTTFLPSFFNLELGTMFRLPLRTAEMAEKSDISKQAVTKDVILELLEVLKEDSDSLLLFLNNIKKISFHKMDKKTSELQEIFTAEVEMSEESTRQQEHLKHFIQKCSSSTTVVSKMESYQVIYEMEIQSSMKHPTKWILANKVGVADAEVTESVQNFCSNLGQMLLPRSSVAACINCNSFQGKAFCFLPLPIETGLPVHINGNFAVDFARRDLWKQDGQSRKMKWNNFLKLYLIAPLYADLLDYIRINLSGSRVGSLKFNSMELCRNSVEPHYLWFFPHVSEEVPQEWQLMINKVYKCIYQRGLCLIPIVRHESNQFHNEKKIITITWSCLTKEKRAEVPHFVTVHITEKLIEILEDVGINLVLQSDYMTKILKGLERACMDVFVLNPGSVRKFLQIHPLNNPGLTKNDYPLLLSESLIKDGTRCLALLDYCLSDVKEGNYNSINSLPLLLTQDNILGKFKRASPKYISKFHDLFPESQMCFANYDINKKYKDLLTAAGFLEDFTISRAEQFIRIKLGYRFQINSTDPHLWLNWTENEQFIEWLKKLWKYFESQMRCDDDKEKTIDKLKLLFSDLAILPVLCPSYNDQHLLAPLGSLSSVICEMTQTSVARILLKLGFAKIASDYFSMKVMFNFIRPHSLKTDDKTSILQHLRLTKLNWNNLSEWEVETILRFLHSGMETSDDKLKYQEQLKTLPLFETMEESFESIEMYNVIYIINTQFSDTFPHLYKLDSSCMFLKKTRINTEVSEDLGIQVIDDVQFFMDYILPNIEQIFNDQKLDVIRLLYNIICCYNTAYEMNKEQIVSTLKNVKLIKAKNGIFQKASYFYENSGRLFKIMIPTENFVPENFFKTMGCYLDDSNLNKLLKDLGLKCSVSSDDFIAFASQISEEVKLHAPLKELFEKSDALVTYLCNMDEENLQKNIYEKVANIKFVYPHKVRENLRSLHSPYAEGRNFVALKDSLVKQRDEDEELVWTSMPILPSKCSQSRNNISKLKAAGAIYNPPETVVIANLRKICLASCKNQSALKTRSKVLQTAYGFLQNHSFDIQSLTDLPIVLVEEDSKLVKINQVVFSLQNYLEFCPYLYRLPPLLAPYREFFQKLDVALEPSASHLTQVLRSLYEDSSKVNSLNQMQMITVKRTLYYLFTLLESKIEERVLEKLKPLYLPASDGILYASDTLCFNDRITTGSRRDASVLKGKFNFLLDLGECHLSPDPYKQINLLQFLPEEIRPKMLSQLTEEILNESVLRICPYGDNCTFRNDFHKLLVSSSFRGGLVSLLKGQCSGELSVSDIEHGCENVFSKMQIICCEKLETILCLGSKQLSNTSIEKQVYSKVSNMGSGVVYLEHRDNVPFSMRTVIIHSLATEINLLLKNALNKDSLLILVLMLSCENPQDIQKVLEDKGIHTGNLKIQVSLDLPNPGEAIPEELIHTLEMDIMHNFRVGEYVGYKGPSSNDYVYAIFIERLSTDMFIKDIRMQKYKIKIGPDLFIVVNHLDLYKFAQQKVPEEVCQNLVVLDIPKDKCQTSSQKYESFDNIKKEIHEYLKEIRNLPKDERQKAIRRLYLKWHPDKNPNNIEVTTKLCHFIQEKVKQLDIIQAENGSSSSTYKSSFSSKEEDFSSFFNQWNSEASRHKPSQSQQKKSQSANEFWSFPKKSQSNPEEAQRWFRQAKCDLKAASNDLGCTGLDCTATEWFYFKIHQAVEKALIAAVYINSGKWISDHSITFLASQVSRYNTKLLDLESIVNKLKEHGVDSKKTQYPNYHSQPYVPNDQFKAGHEQEVLTLAQTVLDNIGEYIVSNS